MKLESDRQENRLAVDDFLTGFIAVRDEIAQLRTSEANWKSEAELMRKYSEKYKRVIENLPQKVSVKDMNSVYLFCNKKFAEDLKIKSDDISGKTDYDLYPREIATQNQADDQRVMRKGGPEEIEGCVPGMEEVSLRKIKVPLTNEDGSILGILDVIMETRENKLLEAVKEQTAKNGKLEEAVRSTHQLYSIILDNAPIATWICVDDRIRVVNSKGAEMLGYSKEELYSVPIKDLLHPEHEGTINKNSGDFSSFCGELEINPLILVHKDGSRRWIEFKASRITWEEKPAMIIYGKDITDQKKKEEGLINSIKQLRGISTTMEESLNGTYGKGKAVSQNLERNNPGKERVRSKNLEQISNQAKKLFGDATV